MKKVILPLLLLLSSFNLSAQESNQQEQNKKYPYYCTISGALNLASKVRIQIEWGDSRTIKAIRDEKGKKIEFNNLTHILNYMSQRGWQFVSALDYDGHVHYLLKKDVSSPEEAKAGLIFDDDIKQEASPNYLFK